MDFTLTIYQQLLESLIEKNYQFLTVEEYFTRPLAPSPPLNIAPSQSRSIAIMRHDVDRKPQNALRMAKIEYDLGVKSTYYFRTIPETFKPNIIKEIAVLGHEIGYHYENLSKAGEKGNPVKYSTNLTGQEGRSEEEIFELAIKDFGRNLNKLREIVPIKTMCMHGSPMSKWGNRDLWKNSMK